MKKYINGKYVEMTQAEIDEMKDRMPEIPAPVKTKIEERVEVLESLFGLAEKFGVR